jgi:hypothetical protein
MAIAVPPLLEEQARRALEAYSAAHPDLAPVVEAQCAPFQGGSAAPQPAASETPAVVPSKGDSPAPQMPLAPAPAVAPAGDRQQPADQNRPAPALELPSIDQILSFLPPDRRAAIIEAEWARELPGEAEAGQPTDRKRGRTAGRAANPGP